MVPARAPLASASEYVTPASTPQQHTVWRTKKTENTDRERHPSRVGYTDRFETQDKPPYQPAPRPKGRHAGVAFVEVHDDDGDWLWGLLKPVRRVAPVHTSLLWT